MILIESARRRSSSVIFPLFTFSVLCPTRTTDGNNNLMVTKKSAITMNTNNIRLLLIPNFFFIATKVIRKEESK